MNLTFEMVQRAVAERVEERADLDWKTTLPLQVNGNEALEEKAAEFAKDVAAMANSGGGLIVYGVQEDRSAGSSAAGKIVPVPEIDEAALKRMRQVLYNLIYPAVTRTEFLLLSPEREPDRLVLALHVLPSEDTPHLVHPKREREWFQAPWRNGPDTALMTERQLADAYRRREQHRHQREQDLDDLYAGVLRSVNADTGSDGRVWVVAAAHPMQPHPDPRRLSKIGATRFLNIVDRHPWVENRPWGDKISPLYLTSGSDVRYGLKLYHRTRSEKSDLGKTWTSRVEVHGNGAVAVGFTRDGELNRDDAHQGHVPITDIEAVGLDLAAMILLMVHAGNTVGDYQVKIGLSSAPEAFRTPASGMRGRYYPADDRYQTQGLQPVEGIAITQLGRTQMLESVTDLIGDAMRQIGSAYQQTGSDLEQLLNDTAFDDLLKRS